MAVSSFDISLGLEGTHIMITGSSGAIGSVLVHAFLAAGAYVTGLDIVEAQNPILHDRYQTINADITNEAHVDTSFEKARSKFGMISTLVASAGLDLSYAPRHSLVDMPFEDWKRVLNVNVDGTFLTCRAWLRQIRDFVAGERNLSAIVFGSEAGRFGVKTCAPYATSKAAIQTGFVLSMCMDAVSINPDVRVNAIAPGPVVTAQYIKECEDDKKAFWREAEATVAMRKPVALETVARTCLFLASDNFSSQITGQCISVDAGKQGNLIWLQDGRPA